MGLVPALTVMDRRFNAVWPSDKIIPPPDVAGPWGEMGFGVIMNMGRVKGWATYRDLVLVGKDREYNRALRRMDMLLTDNRRYILDQAGITTEQLSTIEYDHDIQTRLQRFSEEYDELSAIIAVLRMDIAVLKGKYMIWDFVWPDALDPTRKPDPLDDEDMRSPELFPILEWATNDDFLTALAEGTKDPKSTAGSTTISS